MEYKILDSLKESKKTENGTLTLQDKHKIKRRMVN